MPKINLSQLDIQHGYSGHLEPLPVSWAGKEITTSLDDTDMPDSFLDPFTTWDLYSEMATFVATIDESQPA